MSGTIKPTHHSTQTGLTIDGESTPRATGTAAAIAAIGSSTIASTSPSTSAPSPARPRGSSFRFSADASPFTPSSLPSIASSSTLSTRSVSPSSNRDFSPLSTGIASPTIDVLYRPPTRRGIPLPTIISEPSDSGLLPESDVLESLPSADTTRTGGAAASSAYSMSPSPGVSLARTGSATASSSAAASVVILNKIPGLLINERVTVWQKKSANEALNYYKTDKKKKKLELLPDEEVKHCHRIPLDLLVILLDPRYGSKRSKTLSDGKTIDNQYTCRLQINGDYHTLEAAIGPTSRSSTKRELFHFCLRRGLTGGTYYGPSDKTGGAAASSASSMSPSARAALTRTGGAAASSTYSISPSAGAALTRTGGAAASSTYSISPSAGAALTRTRGAAASSAYSISPSAGAALARTGGAAASSASSISPSAGAALARTGGAAASPGPLAKPSFPLDKTLMGPYNKCTITFDSNGNAILYFDKKKFTVLKRLYTP